MRIVLLLTFIISSVISVNSQQIADTLWTPSVFIPQYKSGSGPVIMIDEAHNNFHTSAGRFRPFCKLLEKDGYKIIPGVNLFTEADLNNIQLLVIANALHAEDVFEWRTPNPSAFSNTEIKIVNEWVKKGGSLFLIADHMPFAGAAADLAASFGFKFYNGFAKDTINKKDFDLFTYNDNSITKNIITDNNRFSIDSIITFTGQAFDIPSDAKSILKLNNDFKIYLCTEAWQFDSLTESVSGTGKSQLAFLKYGRGKVVISGEAAMFTAQITDDIKTGMNSKEAKNNYKLLLNIINWLTDTKK